VAVGEAGEDPEYVPLVSGKDVPQRRRLEVCQREELRIYVVDTRD